LIDTPPLVIFPGCKALPLFDQHQIMLLDDRGTLVWYQSFDNPKV